MSKAHLWGIVVTVATSVVILAALEVARRRGFDPVSRLADVVSPPAAMPTAPSLAPAT